MFGFQKYLDKLYKIKWKINPDDLSNIQEILLVQFKKLQNYYMIDEIGYSYLDILIGLEDIDFNMTKKDDEIIIEILNCHY